MKHCNFHHYAAVIPSYFYTICPFRQLKIILVRHNKQLPAPAPGSPGTRGLARGAAAHFHVMVRVVLCFATFCCFLPLVHTDSCIVSLDFAMAIWPPKWVWRPWQWFLAEFLKKSRDLINYLLAGAGWCWPGRGGLTREWPLVRVKIH